MKDKLRDIGGSLDKLEVRISLVEADTASVALIDDDLDGILDSAIRITKYHAVAGSPTPTQPTEDRYQFLDLPAREHQSLYTDAVRQVLRAFNVPSAK